MTSPNKDIIVAIGIQSYMSLVVAQTGKLKVVSGKLQNFDAQARTLTIELDDIKTNKTLSADDIKSFYFTETFFQDAVLLSRFYSYIDSTGHQQFVMHEPSPPQQPPQPPEAPEAPEAPGQAVLRPDVLGSKYPALSSEGYPVLALDFIQGGAFYRDRLREKLSPPIEGSMRIISLSSFLNHADPRLVLVTLESPTQLT